MTNQKFLLFFVLMIIFLAAIEAKEKKTRIVVLLKEGNAENILKELGEDFDLNYKFKTMDAFSGEITRKGMEKLKKMSVKIETEKEMKIFLQDTTSLINATRAWPLQISEINISGTNESICVIDTGIDYTHEDFGACSNTTFLAGNCSKVVAGYDFVNNDADPYDDNGHGTHVAGIIAANGNIKGIAPHARIVAIKACNSAGSCNSVDVAASIDWCVGNASFYNISVISLSLGSTTLYTTYCDSVDGAMTTAINNATARNISVIAATGNDGNATGIALPACIQNTTAVAWSTKQDDIATGSNRNNITDLIAPGSNINSTRASNLCPLGCTCSGNYMTCSGTSMSTPHVAAAFALLRQFKKLEKNKILKPTEIQDVLNKTGKIIFDSTSGLNFSRINIYNALAFIDETPPQLSLTNPKNITYYFDNLSLNFTVKDLFLASCFYNIDSGSNVSIDCTNTTLDTSVGSHVLRIYANDTAGNFNTSSVSFTIVPNITLIFPANATTTKTASQIFNCSIKSTQISNMTLYIWNSTSLVYINSTNLTGTSNSTNFSYILPYDDVFEWNCLGYDNSSYSAFFSSNFTITLDTTPPSINVISPLNQSYPSRTIDFNVSLNEEGTCNFSLDSAENISMTRNITYFNFTNSSMTSGSHNIVFSCTDVVGNTNYTTSYFVVDIFPFGYKTPLNNTYSNSFFQTFFVNASDDISLSSITFYIWNSTSLLYTNTTNVSGTFNSTNFTYNFTYDNAYIWNILVYDSSNNSNWTENFTLTIDTTLPIVTLISPANASTSTSSTATFSYNVTDSLNIENCSLVINNAINQVDTSITRNVMEEFSATFANAVYFWSINCTDKANNIAASSIWQIVVSYSPAEGTEEGGGGGAFVEISKIYSVDLEKTKEYNKEVSKNSIIKFNLAENEHKIKIIEITPENVTMEIFFAEVIFSKGEEKKFNLSSTEFYDLSVKLKDIKNSVASLTLSKIYEKIKIKKKTEEMIRITKCGDGVCEKNESRENCCVDCACDEGEECIENVCVKKPEKIKETRIILIIFISIILTIIILIAIVLTKKIKRKK